MSKPDHRGRRRPTDRRDCVRYAMQYREEMIDAIRFAADNHKPAVRMDRLALAA